MANLRNRSRHNLIYTERHWGLLIKLTDPDGIEYKLSADYGEPLRTLQTLTDFKKLNPETGEMITITFPVISMRLDALTRKPQSDEKWHCKVQIEPLDISNSMTFDEAIVLHHDSFIDYMIDKTKATEGGSSIGYTRLYLHLAEQTPEIGPIP